MSVHTINYKQTTMIAPNLMNVHDLNFHDTQTWESVVFRFINAMAHLLLTGRTVRRLEGH